VIGHCIAEGASDGGLVPPTCEPRQHAFVRWVLQLPSCEGLVVVQLRHPVGQGAGGLLEQEELKREPPRRRHAAFTVDAIGDEAMLTKDHPAGWRVVPEEQAEACAAHPAGANLHSRLALRRVSIELEPACPHVC